MMASSCGRRLRAGVAACALAAAWAGGLAASLAPAEAGQDVRTEEYRANWGLEAINAGEAYERGLTGAGIKVAVIDSTVLGTHRDLAGRVVASDGFVYRNNDALAEAVRRLGFPVPGDSHGTHVGGIIGANRDGHGMQGVAPGASLVSATAFDFVPWQVYVNHPELMQQFTPVPWLRIFPNAVDYAIASGARVINGSYGSGGYGEHSITRGTRLEYEAYQRAVDAGVILVFAAGNGFDPSDPLTHHPAMPAFMPFVRPENRDSGLYTEEGGRHNFSGLDGMVVAVVAVDRANHIADFSNRCGVAMEWCVAAPGVDILSTIAPRAGDVTAAEARAGYATMDGTSMATPHVSGALALMLEAFPGLDPRTIVRILFATTDDLGAPGVDAVYGHGLINVGRATRGPESFDTTWTMPVAAGGDATLRSDISGAGGLIKTGDGILRLAGDNTFTGGTVVRAGTLLLDGRSVSPVSVGAGGAVGGGGVLNAPLAVRGTLSPGASPGVLTVGGPVTLGPGATFRAEIDGPAAGTGAGFHDQLRVTGAGNTFRANGTLVPVLRGITGAADNSFTPTVGDRFVIVLAEAGVVGRFATVAVPAGLPGLRMDTAYGTDSIALIATPRRYADLGAAGLSESANTRAVGDVLDALRPAAGLAGSGAARTMFASLHGLGAAAVSPALDLASGSIHAEAGRGQGMLRRDMTKALLDPAGAAERRLGEGRVWANAFGGWTRVEGNASGSGVSADRGGVVGGFGTRLGEGAEIGLTFAYGAAGMAQQDTPATADVDVWQAGVYGTWSVGATAVTATVAGGTDRSEVTRPLAMLGAPEASATVDGRGVSAGLEIAHALTADDGTVLRPALGLVGEATWRDGVTESGGGAWRLAVADGSTRRLTALAGISGSTEMTAAGVAFTPSVSLGVSHDLARDDLDARATVQGRSFEAQAAQPGRTGLTLGLGVATQAADGVTLGLSYGFEGQDDARSHAARASVGVTW
ncbi:S8 family serine peptidase [Novispirillum sp. DQ9]|uniref:S8 family serine peptidase n=1 Tax=Novispirillum sp. DQ9 TaxID=3398612 RepID=UPI003C7D468B